jgi:4-diphosphocytidyl-2-C-methyl-D-erythritol kinase
MSSFTLYSPAKLNLYLKILNKRPDGFHDIKTIFERINLADELTFRSVSSERIIIRSHSKDIPLGSKNLIYKAANLLKNQLGVKQGVEIDVKKRIPVAAGMAGGSTNCATALLGLNRLWKLQLSRQELVHFARQLGSDVAFFLYDSSWALGTSRGDEIKPLSLPAKLWHVIVVPRLRLYSADVYGALNLSLTKKKDNASILLQNLKINNLIGIGRNLHNDLEQPIFRLCPKLQDLKARLKVFQTAGVMVSGSGPAVFGIVETEKEAKHIQAILAKRFSQVFVVKTF